MRSHNARWQVFDAKGSHVGRGQVEGIVWSEVDRVCAFAESDNSIAGLRDAALIRLMSDCLLRVSEAVAVNCGDFKKNTLLIAFSKTDQEGRGEALYVGDSTLKLIRRYRSKAGIERGALFRRIRRGDNVTSERLTPTSARRIIKARAEAAGVNGFISGHSLRSALRSRWRRLEHRSLICRRRGVGKIPKCHLTMRKPS